MTVAMHCQCENLQTISLPHWWSSKDQPPKQGTIKEKARLECCNQRTGSYPFSGRGLKPESTPMSVEHRPYIEKREPDSVVTELHDGTKRLCCDWELEMALISRYQSLFNACTYYLLVVLIMLGGCAGSLAMSELALSKGDRG